MSIKPFWFNTTLIPDFTFSLDSLTQWGHIPDISRYIQTDQQWHVLTALLLFLCLPPFIWRLARHPSSKRHPRTPKNTTTTLEPSTPQNADIEILARLTHHVHLELHRLRRTTLTLCDDCPNCSPNPEILALRESLGKLVYQAEVMNQLCELGGKNVQVFDEKGEIVRVARFGRVESAEEGRKWRRL